MAARKWCFARYTRECVRCGVVCAKEGWNCRTSGENGETVENADDNSKNVITLNFMFGVFLFVCVREQKISCNAYLHLPFREQEWKIQERTTPARQTTPMHIANEMTATIYMYVYVFYTCDQCKIATKKTTVCCWDRLRCIFMSIESQTRSLLFHFHLHDWFLWWFL